MKDEAEVAVGGRGHLYTQTVTQAWCPRRRVLHCPGACRKGRLSNDNKALHTHSSPAPHHQHPLIPHTLTQPSADSGASVQNGSRNRRSCRGSKPRMLPGGGLSHRSPWPQLPDISTGTEPRKWDKADPGGMVGRCRSLLG